MITVNLTTTPARLPYIAPALHSLNMQSTPPELIVLWITQECDLSCFVSFLDKGYDVKGISVKFLKEWGSATKLIAPLESNESELIVTADDDVTYPSNWLENLYKKFKGLNHYQPYAVGYRGKILDSNSYKESTCTYAQQNCDVDIITGTWGAMYKAEWFDVEELKQWFTQNQPESNYCDDIVINAYLKSKGIGRYCIKSDSEFKPTKAHSINALWDINKDAPYNDELIKRLGLC